MAMSRALCLALVGLILAANYAVALSKYASEAKSHGVEAVPAGYEERIAVKPLAAANAHLQAGMFKLSPAHARMWGAWPQELVEEDEAAPAATSVRADLAAGSIQATGLTKASPAVLEAGHIRAGSSHSFNAGPAQAQLNNRNHPAAPDLMASKTRLAPVRQGGAGYRYTAQKADRLEAAEEGPWQDWLDSSELDK